MTVHADSETYDRSQLAIAAWDARMRANLRPLLTPELIAEHRRDPRGHHSDALKRVLNYLRRSPSMPPWVIICIKPFEEWQLAHLADRDTPPVPVDDRKFQSEAEAMHALFLLRVAEISRAEAPTG